MFILWVVVQVVQSLFEMMDTSRETYESLVEQKSELEDLWKNEKDKAKVAQRVRLSQKQSA